MPNDADFSLLLSRAQEGDADAEQRLVADNLPLVYAIAKRFYHRGVDPDDLHQLGAIGLLKAIRRFDPNFGVCFSTYAVPMIAGEIKRYLREDGIIHFSRSIKELAAAMQRLLQERPDLTIRVLSEQLGVDEADLAAAAASGTYPRSLDEPDPITGEPFGVSLPAQSQEHTADNRLFLSDLMDRLNTREKELMELRYCREWTQSEVGKQLGISQVQVSRLEKKILTKLREAASE